MNFYETSLTLTSDMSQTVYTRRNPIGTGLEKDLAAVHNPSAQPAHINQPAEDVGSRTIHLDSL